MPTTGLDPRSRADLWGVIDRLRADGTTLVLTTQYLEEADRLTDRIVVIDHGRIVAEGTTVELKDRVGGQRLEVIVADPADIEVAARVLSGLGEADTTVDLAGRRVTLAVDAGLPDLAQAVQALAAADVHADDVALHRPSLDDVFFALTGRPSSRAAAEQEPPQPATVETTGGTRR